MAGWHHRLYGHEFGSWWWTGRPGVLRFMGSQRVGHDWATELNWTEAYHSTLATSCEELTPCKRAWCWEGLGAGGGGDDRGWDGWMASPTRWTWVWVNSWSWWWTGRPGVSRLRFMGSQRVGQDWATELNWSAPQSVTGLRRYFLLELLCAFHHVYQCKRRTLKKNLRESVLGYLCWRFYLDICTIHSRRHPERLLPAGVRLTFGPSPLLLPCALP